MFIKFDDDFLLNLKLISFFVRRMKTFEEREFYTIVTECAGKTYTELWETKEDRDYRFNELETLLCDRHVAESIL